MKRYGFLLVVRAALALVLYACAADVLVAAESYDPLVAAAKREGDEIVFVAGAQTFGGRKGLSEIETAFNKKFGLKARINFAAGPDMNARAARLITELKAGGKSSSDFYLGSQSHFALLHKENVLEKTNWSGTFPWVSKEMEIFPGESVLVYTSLNGILYNGSIIPKDKAPKGYADLIDPRYSSAWAGKIAIPPYVAWLVDLSLVWGHGKVKDYARKLVALSGGRLRYSEEERVISGEFPIMSNMGGAVEAMWAWQAKGAPLVAVPGLIPINTDYFELGVPKNRPIPTLRNCWSRSWPRKNHKPYCRNMSHAARIWSKGASWQNISAITESRFRSQRSRSTITSRAKRLRA